MRYLLTGLFGLLTLSVFFACQKEISVEYGSPAKGSLQSSGGDCLPKTVSGAYVAGKAMNDTNYIDVTVNVTTPGPYTVHTDTVNGYAFKATGTFAAAGTTSVRLKGSGTPAGAGTDDFNVMFDADTCVVSIDVLPSGTGAAVYTLGGSSGACTPFDTTGVLIKDTTLDTRHTVTVTVNVTAVGTYAITTNTANGYYFSKTGTFTTPGLQQVILMGQGKPLAAGTNNFTVTAGALACTFVRTVTATPPAGCNPNVQGTFTAGTATTTTNKVTLTHTYATAGPYTVSTNTTNGYSFGPLSYTATAGANTLTLNATGTPTTAGTNTFTVDFGDGSNCSFNVTVASGTVITNTDYFPTTQGSYWTYNDGTSTTDTFKVIVNGTQAFSGTTFQKFVYSGFYTGTEYYRKDGATGFYYQSTDTSGWGPEVTFNQPRLEIMFLKNALTTGATWNSDFSANILGNPSTLRYKFTCINSNATLTVNGTSFTNVYRVRLQLQGNPLGVFQDAGDPLDYYYAKGIGLVLWEDNVPEPIQSIRKWSVN